MQGDLHIIKLLLVNMMSVLPQYYKKWYWSYETVYTLPASGSTVMFSEGQLRFGCRSLLCAGI